jgi:hypothetical protein
MGDMKNTHKRQRLGSPRCRWENINMCFKDKGVDWIHLDQNKDQQGAYLCMVMNLKIHIRHGIS